MVRPREVALFDHFGHEQIVVAEVELVAHPNFAGRLHQHIPQAVAGAEVAKQKHFYFGTCFLLASIEPRRKNFGIVDNQHIVFVEILEHIFKDAVFDFAGIAVDNHQA